MTQNTAAETSKRRKSSGEFYFLPGASPLTLEAPRKDYELLRIGIDDTDSATLGMCTTYVAARLVGELQASGLVGGFYDYPFLIRLNPTVPNKTRGNGALVINAWARPGREDEVLDLASMLVDEYAALEDEKTHPGIALKVGREGEDELRRLYDLSLHRIVSKQTAVQVARSSGVWIRGWKKGLGIIGATAALGADLQDDRTFEVISYRDPQDRSRERDIDEEAVIRMDREIGGIFFNYDYENHKVCISPASPCPVFFGVRGEGPEAVVRALRFLDPSGVRMAVVFKTNQHTDAHIEAAPSLSAIRPFSSVAATGTVSSYPRTISGGHVIFSLSDGTSEVDCAAYEPTKGFRMWVRRLMPGDRVTVWGSVRKDAGRKLTINLEKMRILSLIESVEKNPVCPVCGSSMESMGRGKGFRCRRRECRYADRSLKKVKQRLERGLVTGYYEAPPVAWRHLYMPLARMKPWN